MATTQTKSRTNYFHVTDIDGFKKLMSRVGTSESEIEINESTDEHGKPTVSFNAYGSIEGISLNENIDDEDKTYEFDPFVDELQKFLPDDDVCILFEISNEKLRYVTGYATIISKTDCKTISLTQTAKELARTMLNDKNWDTECEY